MAALNDQANQDKGFITMQNQVESVTTVFNVLYILVERKYMPSSGPFCCKQCNFFPEHGKFLNFLSKIKHLTKLSKSYSSFCTTSLSLIQFPVMNYKEPSLFDTL